METDEEAGDRPRQKLSFCLFCQHSGSNDPSYLYHIMCMHHCINFRCGKCLHTVFKSRQRLSKHMKRYKGLMTDEEKGKLSPSHVKGASSTSSSLKKKKKHKSKKSQGDSQPDSQMHPQPSLQTSSHASLCHSGCTAKKEPATATPKKKSHSGNTSSKHSREQRLSSKPSSEKDKKKHKSNKHKK